MKLKHYILGLIIIIVDQLSKILIINKNISIIPNFFNLTYTKNLGGAFGFGKQQIIFLLSAILTIGIIIYLIKNKSKIINYIPFILIISGSIGNLIDRIFRGYVIDFIDVNIFNFPNFNIADICIVIGIMWLIINIIKKGSVLKWQQ